MASRHEISPIDLAALEFLREHADQHGVVTASRRAIAESVGCCDISARNALRRLAARGYLQFSERRSIKGRCLANEIRLHRAEG